MEFKDLTEEQKAKLRECKTKEEFVSLLEEEGVELSDDMLEAIAGGEGNCSEVFSCPSYVNPLFCGFYFGSGSRPANT